MKSLATLVVGLAITGISLAPVEARSPKSKYWKSQGAKSKHHYTRNHRRHLGWRHRDERRRYLPLRITQEPNAGHYIYDNYPYWAAKAFQPNWER